MNSPQPKPRRLVSLLVQDDPDLRDLVEEFVEGLSVRAQELRSALEGGDWERLKVLSHQLKGAGGSYGYPDITTLAATMEAACKKHESDQFDAWIIQLSQLILDARQGLDLA